MQRSLVLSVALLVGALSQARADDPRETAANLGLAFRRAAERARASIVFIEAGVGEAEQGAEAAPRQATPADERAQVAPVSSASGPHGTGFVVRKDGTIVTNHRVVAGARRLQVTFADGRRYGARLIGADPHTDIAVIRIDGDLQTFAPLALGDSEQLRPGEWVVAVGARRGGEPTITAGIVSAGGRATIGAPDREDFILTDARINPSNTGGPLLDLRGEVVGLTTTSFSSGDLEGVGVAVPSELVRRVRDQLMDGGPIARGWLGMRVQDVTPELAELLRVSPDVPGVVVTEVTEGSPASVAGIAPGDVVEQLDGREVQGSDWLRETIGSSPPGKQVGLRIIRDGQARYAEAEVAARDEARPVQPSARAERPLIADADDHGLVVTPPSPTEAQASDRGVGPGEGLIVRGVVADSPAGRAGIEIGDRILRVGDARIQTVDDYLRAARQAKDDGDGRILVLVMTDRGSRFAILDERP